MLALSCDLNFKFADFQVYIQVIGVHRLWLTKIKEYES